MCDTGSSTIRQRPKPQSVWNRAPSTTQPEQNASPPIPIRPSPRLFAGRTSPVSIRILECPTSITLFPTHSPYQSHSHLSQSLSPTLSSHKSPVKFKQLPTYPNPNSTPLLDHPTPSYSSFITQWIVFVPQSLGPSSYGSATSRR